MKVWNGYQKGVNLGGWFSQCDYSQDRLDHFIEKEDFAVIANWGCDHVRVPVDYNIFMTEDGAFIESGFQYIDNVIAWTKENGLNMVLDLHKTAGFSFDAKEKETGFFYSEKYQEMFYSLWEQFANRYGKYSHVAFELLNEVTDKEYMPAWKEISAKCIERIRKITKDTYILIGSYWNNHVEAVEALQMPVDDKIVYNFHCYDPLIFTHQGAYWVNGMPLDYRLHYDNTYNTYYEEHGKLLSHVWGGFLPGVPDMTKKFGAEFFENLFAKAVRIAEERNVALYCGEYGVIENASPEDILGWYKDINKAFVKYGIGRSAWSYRGMDFDLCGDHLKSVIADLTKVL